MNRDSSPPDIPDEGNSYEIAGPPPGVPVPQSEAEQPPVPQKTEPTDADKGQHSSEIQELRKQNRQFIEENAQLRDEKRDLQFKLENFTSAKDRLENEKLRLQERLDNKADASGQISVLNRRLDDMQEDCNKYKDQCERAKGLNTILLGLVFASGSVAILLVLLKFL